MHRSSPILLGVLALGACVPERDAEDPSGWFDPGQAADVEETVAFTDVNYDFPANDADGLEAFIAAVYPVSSGAGADTVAFGADDQYGSGNDCRSVVEPDLPFEVEGIVTAFPRFYFKTSGCDWDSDEKYYGSFFLQDRTGGLFVLGDTKVAHFGMGDRIKVRIRGAKTSYDLNMAYTYDLIDVLQYDVPIYYEEPTGPFSDMFASGDNPIGKVYRVTGTVTQEKDTFGEFHLETDAGVEYAIGLDAELNRRGVDFPLGQRITVTGPVLYSYSVFTIVVMRRGQVTVETD